VSIVDDFKKILKGKDTLKNL